MIKSKKSRGAAGLAILLIGAVATAEDKQAVEAIVVTATRLDATTEELAQAAVAIDAEAIELQNPASLVELLRRFAGVHVAQQGGRGGVSNILIRGGEPNFTAVFIDGVRVNDLTNSRGGAYDPSGFDWHGAARVEIVRGPLSALYGSEALAGVVQIFTEPAEPGGKLRAEIGGGYAYTRAAFAGGGNTANWSLAAHAVRDDADDAGSAFDSHGFDGSVRLGTGDRGQWSAGLSLLDTDIDRFPEDSGGPLYAVRRERDHIEGRAVRARLGWERLMPAAWDVAAAARYYGSDETASSPGIAPGVLNPVPASFTRTEFDRYEGVVTLRRSSRTTRFAAGAELRHEVGDSLGVLDVGIPLPTDFRLERDSYGAFVEGGQDIGDLSLQGSIRYDDVQDVGSETTWHAGAIYRLPDGKSALRGNAGRGFKAPGFFAMSHPIIGNALLRPERARSWDIQYSRSFAAGEWRLGWFINEYQDLVDFDPLSFRLVNRASVETRGVEFELSATPVSQVDLVLHATYGRSEVPGSDVQLRGRPDWRGGFIIDWSIDDAWQLNLSALAVDKFYESSIATGMLELDGYTRFDVALRWRMSDYLTWTFAVDNLLDEKYEEAVGFPAPGTRVRLGVIVD